MSVLFVSRLFQGSSLTVLFKTLVLFEFFVELISVIRVFCRINQCYSIICQCYYRKIPSKCYFRVESRFCKKKDYNNASLTDLSEWKITKKSEKAHNHHKPDDAVFDTSKHEIWCDVHETKMNQRERFTQAIQESKKKNRSVVKSLKPSGEASKRQEEALFFNSKMAHRVSKEANRQLAKQQILDEFPRELREIYGEPWYDEIVNASIEDLIIETDSQKKIIFLATKDMLKRLEEALIAFGDGTWDLSSKSFVVSFFGVIQS